MQPETFFPISPRGLVAKCIRHRILLLMLLASAMLHMILLTGFSIGLPQLFEARQTLEMRLVQQPPEPVQPKQPIPKTKPRLKHKPPAIKTENPPAPSPASETVQAATDTATQPALDSNLAPPETDDDSTETSSANLQEDSEETPKKAVYRHVDTEFEVMRGNDKSAAGITRVSFNIDENNRYSITSITQAKGLVSLFFGNLTQKSEGSVTENGLKPDFYAYQYGNDAKKSQSANFAWDQNILHMHTAKGETTARLVAGTQDFLSFMYQFMFTAPLDSMQITMTNGKRLRTYTYSFEGEETLSTKLGTLNTVHLLKSRGDEEKTEIWLATDYQYLPVKIRKTEKDGTVIEQIATSLSTQATD